MNRKRIVFGVFDLVIMSLLAAMGIAIKPIVSPLVHLLTGPLMIPGGSVAGGIYMLWLVLAAALVGKPFAGSFTALVQGIMVVAGGGFGSHGIFSLVTYLLPGVVVDVVWWLLRRCDQVRLRMFFCGCCANVTGTLLSNFIFFRMPLIPLLLALVAAAISGGVGGLLTAQLLHGLEPVLGSLGRPIPKRQGDITT